MALKVLQLEVTTARYLTLLSAKEFLRLPKYNTVE